MVKTITFDNEAEFMEYKAARARITIKWLEEIFLKKQYYNIKNSIIKEIKD